MWNAGDSNTQTNTHLIQDTKPGYKNHTNNTSSASKVNRDILQCYNPAKARYLIRAFFFSDKHPSLLTLHVLNKEDTCTKRDRSIIDPWIDRSIDCRFSTYVVLDKPKP